MFDEARPPVTPLMQDPAFARALQLCGQEPVILPNGQLLLRRRIAGITLTMLPRATPPDDLADQLRTLALHRTPLILSPQVPCPLPRAMRLRAPVDLAVLDLRTSHKNRRARLHGKWRNQLKRSEEQDLKVTRRPLPADPDTAVLRQEMIQSRSRGYANWSAPLTAGFAKAAQSQTHVFRALHKGHSVAHMLFLSHGTCVTYHLGHISDDGKKRGAHNLLLWRAMRYFANRGFLQMDLGMLRKDTPELNRFKLRSGATRQKTGGTHLYWHLFTGH